MTEKYEDLRTSSEEKIQEQAEKVKTIFISHQLVMKRWKKTRINNIESIV